MARLSDTTPEATRVWLEALRRLPFPDRWRQIGEAYQLATLLQAAGRGLKWDAAVHGPDENLRILEAVIAALTRSEILYTLTGSWGSCLFGTMRLTLDADLMIEAFPGKEAAFCACFGEDYLVDTCAVQEAVRDRSHFTITHLSGALKVNCFVQKDRPFDRSALARRRPYTLPGSVRPPLQCASPEDFVLFLLDSHRLGNASAWQQ